MKCTYLYNHAIYFNQTLHKLGKQSELSNCMGKIMTFDLFQGLVIQYGCQTLFQSAKISMYIIDHISKNPWDILLIYFLFFGYSHVLNYRSKNNYIDTFIGLQDPVKWLSVRLLNKVQGRGNYWARPYWFGKSRNCFL